MLSIAVILGNISHVERLLHGGADTISDSDFGLPLVVHSMQLQHLLMSISPGFSYQQRIALLALTKAISRQSIMQQAVVINPWTGT